MPDKLTFNFFSAQSGNGDFADFGAFDSAKPANDESDFGDFNSFSIVASAASQDPSSLQVSLILIFVSYFKIAVVQNTRSDHSIFFSRPHLSEISFNTLGNLLLYQVFVIICIAWYFYVYRELFCITCYFYLYHILFVSLTFLIWFVKLFHI